MWNRISNLAGGLRAIHDHVASYPQTAREALTHEIDTNDKRGPV